METHTNKSLHQGEIIILYNTTESRGTNKGTEYCFGVLSGHGKVFTDFSDQEQPLKGSRSAHTFYV